MRKTGESVTENKKTPWRTVGLVVTALAAIIVVPPTFRSCQIAERSLEQSQKKSDVALPRGQKPKNVLTPLSASPREIMEDVKSRPSLQQRDVINSYIGNRVDWLLELSNAREDANGQVDIALSTSVHDNRGLPILPLLVSGKVKLSDHPWLKVTPDGGKVWVRGTIRDIEALGIIKLDDIELGLAR